MKWYKIFNNLSEAKTKVPLGKTQLLIARDQRICLAHTHQGFFAIDDACPHMGESLTKGTTNYLNEIVCPWHNHRFSLTTGTECKDRTAPGRLHKIELREDGLYLGVQEH
ncbi:MAG: Rieske 2Fe-2S domain-containing protein [Bacteroidetes bacterium]|nr:Rieske 2Fe-2S domain-containing protein [Bacteroidota bacterium]